MSLNLGRVCRLCLTDTDCVLPLFNEDVVLPTRIMIVVPIVKVYVLLLYLLCIFFKANALGCQRDWVSWVIWQL
jgi:hypothetical protein